MGDVIGRAPKRARLHIPFGTIGRMAVAAILIAAAMAVNFGILAVTHQPWAAVVAVVGGTVFLAAAVVVGLGGTK